MIGHVIVLEVSKEPKRRLRSWWAVFTTRHIWRKYYP